jgi:hypothetical protein
MKNKPGLCGVVVALVGLTPACAVQEDESVDEADIVGVGVEDGAKVSHHCSLLDAQLIRAREATLMYRDVDVAIAAGFMQSGECVSHPVLGAMGYHFVNPARLADPLVIEEPEALLYVLEGDTFRLVAIEYLQLIFVDGMPYLGCGVENESCPPANPPPAPSLFDGITFDGPMAGHQPGMPWHFDQHVWLYESNPSGLFAPFNPALSCTADDCEDPH